MADSTIHTLTAGSALVGTEEFETVISPFGAGDDRRHTATQIKAFCVGAGLVAVASGKTFTASNTLTLAGTDASTLNVGAGGTLGTAAFKATGTSGNTVPLLDAANTWTLNQTCSQNFIAIGSLQSQSSMYIGTGADSAELSNAAALILRIRNGGGSAGVSLEVQEVASAPSAPASTFARIYAVDNGSGKTRLMVLFKSGAAQQLAIEP